MRPLPKPPTLSHRSSVPTLASVLSSADLPERSHSAQHANRFSSVIVCKKDAQKMAKNSNQLSEKEITKDTLEAKV